MFPYQNPGLLRNRKERRAILSQEAISIPDLDIIVPVYNEADNIIPFLLSLKNSIKSIFFRILICYDFEEDTTLSAIKKNTAPLEGLTISYIRNGGRGPHGAVVSGFKAALAQAVLVMPADDCQNAGIINQMFDELKRGAYIVCASRLMLGGSMRRCPLLKNILVRGAGYSLYYLAGLPTRDATNGFRMFAKTLLDRVTIQSTVGFTYSIELLVKCHRLHQPIVEIPAHWIERDAGKSRFKVLKWLIPYLRWYFYAFSTIFLRRRLSLSGELDS